MNIKITYNYDAVKDNNVNNNIFRILNLCGSSVSLEPVKFILKNCPNLHSINLQSCRALPRGIKRLYTGDTIQDLKQTLQGRPKNEVSESENEQSPAHPIPAVE